MLTERLKSKGCQCNQKTSSVWRKKTRNHTGRRHFLSHSSLYELTINSFKSSSCV